MKTILYKLFEHQYLSKEEAYHILLNIAQGKYNDHQIASLITVFLMRSITVEELIGFREALLELSLPLSFDDFKAIDIVGTGGDGKNTFNISTLSSFVVAGAGYKVVKHGNYAATSMSGASNLIEYYGVKFTQDEAALQRSLEQCGVAYLHAPLFNPALKAVAPVRQRLGVRSFFNVLGPLVNPAKPRYQLLGVYNLSMLRLYTYINQESDVQFSVVHSLDGYDEISLTSDFKVATPYEEKQYQPEMLGFARVDASALSGGDSVEEAAKIFRDVLHNEATDAQRNCVIANAGMAIHTLCPEKNVTDCLHEAKESLLSRRAAQAFEQFITIHS